MLIIENFKKWTGKGKKIQAICNISVAMATLSILAYSLWHIVFLKSHFATSNENLM